MLRIISSILSFFAIAVQCQQFPALTKLNDAGLTINSIPWSTRVYWMRQANAVLAQLASPCPFAAFASVIVNHTDPSGMGELVCIGVNSNRQEGNPTLHGEIAAINNCSRVLTDPDGAFKLSPADALNAFADLSLYTNAESCPMCASAVRWAGMREYIYGTSIETLIAKGWGQIRIASQYVVQESYDLPLPVRMLANVLANETDPYFLWQFDPSYPCPTGCQRSAGSCAAVTTSNSTGGASG